jgi:cytochrome c peroxidase
MWGRMLAPATKALAGAILVALLSAPYLGRIGAEAAQQRPEPGASTVVAAVDIASESLDGPDARKLLERSLIAASTSAAKWIVLPGPILPGAPYSSAVGEPIPGATSVWAGRLAKLLNVTIVIPVFETHDEMSDTGGPFLTVILVNPDGAVEYRSRAVLPDPAFSAVPTSRGSYRDTRRTIDIAGWRVGILAGSDIMTGLMRLSDLGADVVFVAANLLSDEERRKIAKLAQVANTHIVVANRRAPGSSSAFVATADGNLITASGANLPAVTKIAPIARGWRSEAPLGLPQTVPQPNRLLANSELADLGRELFMERRLSSTGTVSCASCHNPLLAFANGAERGSGVFGRKTKRNVPSLLNVAYRPLLRWDGYASSLENFVKYPMSGPSEMNFHHLDQVVSVLQEDTAYRAAFERIFGAGSITFEEVEQALAAYMRTLLSGNSAFDRFYFGGDTAALSDSQRRGFELFFGKANCGECHSIGRSDALFTDFDYHNLGVGWRPETASHDDIGLGGISSAKLSGQFLTPSLREVGRTVPYMHDGSLGTLRDVVEFFDRGGNAAPGLDPRVVPLNLTGQDKADLVEFLESLTGDAQWTADGRPNNDRHTSGPGASQ